MEKLYKSQWLSGHPKASIFCFLTFFFILLSSSSILAQSRDSIRITGIVKDSTGLGLPGVNLSFANGRSRGTVSDLAGKFKLVAREGDVVSLSYIGFQTTSFTASAAKPFVEILMQPDAAGLKEVVITAFGKKERKEAVVGSVTTISPGQLKIPSSNLTNALAGQVAGVVAYQRSGQPGLDNSTFFIRGVTTFGY